MHNAATRGMRIRTMLNYMRGYYTLIYFHIHNICARVCTLVDKIFAYPQYMCVCARLQCKYCAGVLCCYMLYTVQCTLNSLYIYIETGKLVKKQCSNTGLPVWAFFKQRFTQRIVSCMCSPVTESREYGNPIPSQNASLSNNYISSS